MVVYCVDWVDIVKGICIVFVVMMYLVLGVEVVVGEIGWMYVVVVFVVLFCMLDFFLILGLFLLNVIVCDWKFYLDWKVVYFVYFYIFWMMIQFVVKVLVFVSEMGWVGVLQFYFFSFLQLFGIFWFIYMLLIFFVVCKIVYDWGVFWQLMLVIGVVL